MAMTEKQLAALKAGRHHGGTKGSHWNMASRLAFSKKKKGIPLSDAHCAALSLAKKGKTIPAQINTPESRLKTIIALTGKPQPWNRGPLHHNWQGGITDLNHSIRASLQYKQWRRAVQKKDDFTCKICGHRGGKIHADHIKKFAQLLHEYNIKTLAGALSCAFLWDVNNGQVLCSECHRKTDTWGGGKFYAGKIKN